MTRPSIQRPDARQPRPDRLRDTRSLARAILAGEELESLLGPWLVVVEGPARGERLALRDGAVLGRGRAAELRLRDPSASRRHARLTMAGSRLLVEDLGSKNGFAVNGRPAGRAEITLRPGDALALGESVLVYEEGEEAPDAGDAPPSPPGPPGMPEAAHRPGRPVVSSRCSMAALALVALSVLLAALASP